MDDWQSLGDVQYRKWEVYAMLWDNVDLEALLVACAPFGGPIATVGLGATGTSLLIYTASGTLLSEVERRDSVLAHLQKALASARIQ